MVFIASAELALVRGEYVRAVEMMDRLIAALAQVHIRPYGVCALHLKGKAMLALGNSDCAVEVWETARREAEAMGSRTLLWQVLSALSKVEAERGRAAQAETLRVKAHELIKYIANHTPDELRESFLNLPDVRAILA
jgi:ATP/maltotriose-dependent transcriptional regulator MalT